ALVRRRTGRVDQLPAVLPGAATGRIRVRPLAGVAAQHAYAGHGTRGAAGGVVAVSADRAAVGLLEAGIERRPFGAHPAAAGGDRRRAVPAALGHRTAAAALVHAQRAGEIALAAVRVVE